MNNLKYCFRCGHELEKRYIEKEGDIPYCKECKQFIFPFFSTACSMIVFNQTKDKIFLIKQYGNDDYILVAGYVSLGENVETTVQREIKEEIGVDVESMTFNKTSYYKRTNTLMANFAVTVDETKIKLNEEVDEGCWFSIEDARKNIKDQSLAQQFLENFLKKYDNFK